MSFAVVRGESSEAQLYLDHIINSIGCDASNINLAKILFHCMTENSNGTFMINGATGETFTTQQILERSVALASALVARGATGKNVIFLMGNHQHMAALYYATIFAGVVPFLAEPDSTVHEVKYYIDSLSPNFVFADNKRRDDVMKLAETSSITFEVVIADVKKDLDSFIGDHNKDGFIVSDVSPDSSGLMLPTSGSTGLPKMAVIAHKALVAQLPFFWTNSNRVPNPTKLAMLISTEQWMTHSMYMTSCPVFRVPILMSPNKPTAAHVLDLMEQYQPSFLLMSPAFGSILATSATPKQLACVETLVLCGSAVSAVIYSAIQDKMPNTGFIANLYGMTEMSGGVTVPSRHTPRGSSGAISNVIQYKIVDEHGSELGAYKKGELCIKSEVCIVKGYLDNGTYRCNSTFTKDGWLKTGDAVYKDDHENIFFCERIKLIFKYMNYQISPEEVESVIGAVRGVQESVVCYTDAGAGAIVVPWAGSDITRDAIHDAVNDALSYHKRLHGGIAFVASLPRLKTGKVDRQACNKMISKLREAGECY